VSEWKIKLVILWNWNKVSKYKLHVQQTQNIETNQLGLYFFAGASLKNIQQNTAKVIDSHFPWHCFVDISYEVVPTLKAAASRLFREKPRITEYVVLANVLDVFALPIAAHGGSRITPGNYFFGRTNLDRRRSRVEPSTFWTARYLRLCYEDHLELFRD
jgi:hypothetical protein